ncbi:ribbon-helix-helix domain-containing protein [Candidatus Methanoprimaticola sp. MG2]|uniref:ribbon-helix-helix domain-containing protein n=1 Tax=Candidatus Methanoprimaticola sp. MG2 TaxID=3228838 RepID=UPI0039C6DB68
MKEENRPKVGVTIDPALLKWVDSEVETKRFASRSHAFEAALFWYRKYLEEGELPPR